MDALYDATISAVGTRSQDGSAKGDGSVSSGQLYAVALPSEAPLRMERARLHRIQTPLRRKGWRAWLSVAGLAIARLLVILSSVALAAYGIREMVGVISTDHITPLQYIFLAFFTVSFAWIAFSFMQASFGFFRHLVLRVFPPRQPRGPLTLQTAVLVPLYNEEPVRVAANVLAMAEALAERQPGRFCFFFLSDTNRAEAWVAEEAAIMRAIEAAPEACPIYYRHRSRNIERKAGNIAEWVMRFGGAYEAMLVLDADSLMDAETMEALAKRLQAEPSLGLIQSHPRIIRGRTLYARLQQFANSCYGPIFANGLAFWHGYASNFWGHNAIIRVHAFAEAARLPILSGKPPFGGHILSHDFAEAAFLRRAGWGVRLDTDLAGSYEEAPPSLIDVMIRDRRWCQGNFQHGRLLFARGFSLASRLHFTMGILSYLTAVFWFLLVLSGLALAIQAQTIRPEYFAEPSLFPSWPVFNSERATDLFLLSVALVLGPKLLGWLAAMLDLRALFRFGGPIVLTASILWETLLSALFAAVMMLAQTRIVVSVLLGRDSGWQPQRRDDGHVPLGEVVRVHLWHTLMGFALAGIAWWAHEDLFWWLSPVTLGLVLSIPLSVASSSRWVAAVTRVLRLGRTPEESRQPAILRAATEQHARLSAALEDAPEGAPVERLAKDPVLCAWHLAQADQDTRGVRPDDNLLAAWAKAMHERDPSCLSTWLTPAQTMALLAHPTLLPFAQRDLDGARATANARNCYPPVERRIAS